MEEQQSEADMLTMFIEQSIQEELFKESDARYLSYIQEVIKPAWELAYSTYKTTDNPKSRSNKTKEFKTWLQNSRKRHHYAGLRYYIQQLYETNNDLRQKYNLLQVSNARAQSDENGNTELYICFSRYHPNENRNFSPSELPYLWIIVNPFDWKIIRRSDLNH